MKVGRGELGRLDERPSSGVVPRRRARTAGQLSPGRFTTPIIGAETTLKARFADPTSLITLDPCKTRRAPANPTGSAGLFTLFARKISRYAFKKASDRLSTNSRRLIAQPAKQYAVP